MLLQSASKVGTSARHIALNWLAIGAGVHPIAVVMEFLSVVPVTTAQTVRTTTRALAHVNRTCVQTEREIEEEEMILWRTGLMPYFRCEWHSLEQLFRRIN